MKNKKMKVHLKKNLVPMPCTYTCASHGSPARTRTPPWGRTRYLRRPGRPIHASTASSIRTALVGNATAAPIIYMFISPPLTGRPAIPTLHTAFRVTHTNSEAQFLNENQEILSLARIDIRILRHVIHLNFSTFSQNEQKLFGVLEIL